MAVAQGYSEVNCLCVGGDRADTAAMAAWREVEQAEPEFAARVQRLFDSGRHKTIATLLLLGSLAGRGVVEFPLVLHRL